MTVGAEEGIISVRAEVAVAGDPVARDYWHLPEGCAPADACFSTSNMREARIRLMMVENTRSRSPYNICCDQAVVLDFLPPVEEESDTQEWEACWKCGEPLTPENAPRVEGGIECQSCLTVWAVPEEAEPSGD